MQQSSLNLAHLKLPVEAVPGFLLRAPASGIVALTGIHSDRLRVLLNHTEVAAGDRRALFLSFDGLNSADAMVERAVDALADAALQMWPVWYSSVSFADIRDDTLGREAARVRLHEIAKLIPRVSRAWAERAVTKAIDGRKLRGLDVALATELEQLCLVINCAGLILITNHTGSEAEASALVHALEWMTRNAHIAVAMLFERLPESKSLGELRRRVWKDGGFFVLLDFVGIKDFWPSVAGRAPDFCFARSFARDTKRCNTDRSRRTCEQLRQLGDIAGNPSRLIFSEQLGCHASLIFGVWPICTIQVPKDFRASMYARHRRAREGLVR